MKRKIILFPLVFLLWIWLVFAANNFLKKWDNWDANVSHTTEPNDVFTLKWRLDIEPSTTDRYKNYWYRWKIEWTIESQLFWEFSISWSLDLKEDEFYGVYEEKCDTTDEVEIYKISWSIKSDFWWEMSLKNNSYFCSNQYISLTFNSDSLGNKDIWTFQGDLWDDFWKQQISISGIAKLKWDADILQRWDDWINKLWVDISNKSLYTANLNKNIFNLFKTYKNDVKVNDYSIDEFNATSWKEEFYLYNYVLEEDTINFNWNDYTGNKWKNLKIWNNWTDIIKIEWKNTVIVKSWNIYINSNLDNGNDSSDLLILIAKRWNDWKWWNIYIDPDVTNIDAILIADWSLISMDWDKILKITDDKDDLRKQLLIYGSVLSSNTIWDEEIPYWADLYEEINPNKMPWNIYDLWNLRSFNLNYWWTFPCTDTWSLVPIGNDIDWYELEAWAWKKRCYNSDPIEIDSWLRGSEKLNPVIIEYNNRIQLLDPFVLRK